MLAQDVRGLRDQGPSRSRGCFAVEEPEEAGGVVVAVVVRLVDDGGDAADGFAVARGEERKNLPVDAVKRRVGLEVFRDATGKRRDETRRRCVKGLRQPLELRVFPRRKTG